MTPDDAPDGVRELEHAAAWAESLAAEVEAIDPARRREAAERVRVAAAKLRGRAVLIRLAAEAAARTPATPPQ